VSRIARAAGIALPNSRKLTPQQKSEAIRRRDLGETLASIARDYGVNPSTIFHLGRPR
jgi:transposase-like protein